MNCALGKGKNKLLVKVLETQWEIFIDFGVNTEIISGVFANGVMVVIYTKILHLYYTQFD